MGECDLGCLVSWYFFNWVSYAGAQGGIIGCWLAGGWGLFWLEDRGNFMMKCNALFQGVQYTGVDYTME